MNRFSARLFPPPADGSVPLVLRPLLIAGMSTPVASADGGINISTIEEDPKGLLSAIDPYLDMYEGDVLTVYIEGNPLPPIDVKETDEGKRIFFHLPADRFNVEWVENIHFEVLRKDATAPEPSAPLRLRVKQYRPGGVDKEPHLPGHSELPRPRVPQDVIDNGVTAEWAAKGVPVTIDVYPDRAPQDVVVLDWGSVKVPRVISEAEAAGNDPVEILVGQDVILAAGDSDALQLSHWPHDEVWNFASDRSRPTVITVEAGAWRLEEPIIKEAVNGVIDLAELKASDVTVFIRTNQSPIAVGDSIEFTWVGTLASGEQLEHRQTLTVESVPALLEAKVPNRLVRSTAQGTGDASYVLRPADGSPAQSSKRAFARIEGDIYQLPAPIVLEAIEDLIDDRTESAWVLAGPYPGMGSGDVVNLVWRGTRANGTPYLYEEEKLATGKEEPLQFHIEREHIEALAGGTLELYYRVANDSAALYGVRESDRSYYRVTTLRHTLPAPEVLESDGEVLDPEWIFPNGATLHVGYTDWLEDDILTYYWRSVYPDGTTSDWLEITQGQVGRPVDFRISPAVVEVSRTTLILAYYTVKRAGTEQVDISDFLELYIGTPIPLAITAAVDSYGAVANGGISVDTAVTLSGTARARFGVDMLDGDAEVGSAGADADGVWYFPMTELVPRSYSVKARAQYGRRLVSEPWEFTVVAYVVPSITRIEDSRREVAEGATTVDTTVTVSGLASPGLQIDLLEGEVSLHTVDVDLGGAWSVDLEGLTIRSHELKARAVYGNKDLSAPRAFEVVAELAPTLDSVQDSRGELADGKTTVDTQIVLAGKASIGQPVQILDGSVPVDTARADLAGNWTLTLRNLQVKGYSIKVRALYGRDQESAVRRFTVVDYIFPTIISVLDSRGEVPDGGATVDTALTLGGEASANEQVEIFDGNASLGVPTVSPGGIWTLRLDQLPIKVYGVRAKALYGAGEESAVRTFTVYEEIRPSITSVRDSDGEVTQGGTTVHAQVSLVGKASINQKIELFEGANSLGEVPVDASGNWSHLMVGLERRAYSLTAKALYGAGLVSDARTFTVVEEVAPSIVRVQDSLGDVANNGFTYDSSVTVTGTASIGRRVELFDGATSKGQAAVNGSGNWSAVVSALTVGQHLVKAVALYGSKLESSGHSFEMRQGATPVITRVVDSKGQPIGNGGRTYETGLTLHGSAQAGLKVEMLDNGTSGPTVAAPGGNWQAPMSGLAVGRHAFTAKGLYGNQPVSGEWIVTVENRPPLVIDTSPLVLNGRLFVRGDNGQGPSVAPANTSRQRVASGGVPPYEYSSSNTAVASVDSNGTVRSRGNGSAVITVRDQAQQSVSYNVTVQNVIRMYFMSSAQYIVGWDQRIFMGDLREVFNQYRAGGGLGQIGWPGGTYWARDQRLIWNPLPRQQAQHKDMNGGGEGWSAQLGPSFPGIRLG
ncbi:hypothetical protein [Pseudomonas sp. UBA4617]|uniref:hypothetical protein n=1 Tax=Pseudomonas sp. UBA4617 TaxID=1947318 RepID=UPI0025EAD6FB|nr:hypothetical protein [Pseudomonas sp. UBA4617]